MPKTKTHEQYVAELKADRRGIVALEDYKGGLTPILHRCSEGHSWEARPSGILNGKGCPWCCGLKTAPYPDRLKVDGRGFIALEAYVSAGTAIKHQCTQGHTWKGRPNDILNKGYGCPYCGRRKAAPYVERLKNDGRGFVALERYEGSGKPILHRCPKGHDWRATPNDVVNRKRGCPVCAGRVVAPYTDRLKETGRGIIAVEAYVNIGTPIDHQCPYGHVWKVKPSHVLDGSGCPHCAGQRPEPYEERLKLDGRGIVALEPYTKAITPILHKCSLGHIWKTAPTNIMSGRGCPSCATSGFDASKPATLYYLRVAGGRAYKVGITNRTVRERFMADLERIEIIKETLYEIGQDAYDAEQLILNQFKHCRYAGDDLLSSGNTEMFDYDVLGLDTMEQWAAN